MVFIRYWKTKESGTKVLASQLFLDCRARRSGCVGSTTLISSAFTTLLNCAEVRLRNRILMNYRFLSHSHFFRRTKIPTSITIPSDAIVPYADKLSSRNFLENCNRANSKSSKALHSIISLKLGFRFIYFKNDLCNLLIWTVLFWNNSMIHGIKI